eukprot:g1348.t1
MVLGSESITLKSGAVVYLELTVADSGKPLVVFADGFAHSDVRLAPEREIDFSQALFRVVPRLLYTAALNDNATEEELKRERENNAATLESSTPLNYGNVIQLQHVQSGKFLTVDARSPARLEPACHVVSLEEQEVGKDRTWLEVKASWRARTQGSEVFYGDELRLAAVNSQLAGGDGGGSFLHASTPGFDALFDPSRSWRELNVLASKRDPERIDFALKLFCARPQPEFLALGDVVRLYHPEAEGYVTAKADVRDAGKATTLARMPPEQMDATALFVVEDASKRGGEGSGKRGGPVPFHARGGAQDNSVRIRHVASGNYLCIKEGDSHGARDLVVDLSPLRRHAKAARPAADRSSATRFFFRPAVNLASRPEFVTAADYKLGMQLCHQTTSKSDGRTSYATWCLTIERSDKDGGFDMKFKRDGADGATDKRDAILQFTRNTTPEYERDCRHAVSLARGLGLYRRLLRQHAGADLPEDVDEHKLSTDINLRAVEEMLIDVVRMCTDVGNNPGLVHQFAPIEATGLPLPQEQRLMAELRVIDSLFEVISAPMAEKWTLGDFKPPFSPMARLRVVRRAYKALVHVFRDNTFCQRYVCTQYFRPGADDGLAESAARLVLNVRETEPAPAASPVRHGRAGSSSVRAIGGRIVSAFAAQGAPPADRDSSFAALDGQSDIAFSYFKVARSHLGFYLGAATAMKMLMESPQSAGLASPEEKRDMAMKLIEILKNNPPDKTFLRGLRPLARNNGGAVPKGQAHLLECLYSAKDHYEFKQLPPTSHTKKKRKEQRRKGKGSAKLDESDMVHSESEREHYLGNASCVYDENGKFKKYLCKDILVSWTTHREFEFLKGGKGPSDLHIDAVRPDKQKLGEENGPRALRDYDKRVYGSEHAVPDREWARLEDLVWMLDATDLYKRWYEKRGGEGSDECKDWPMFQKRWGLGPGAPKFPAGSVDAAVQANFEQKKKLALYYCTQLDLFADLCAGRASSCIAKLREQFGFDLLLSAVVSKTLPSQVKTAMCRLMLVLYIDFSPHEPLRLPRALRLVDDRERQKSEVGWVAFEKRDWMEQQGALIDDDDHRVIDKRKFLLLQDFIRDRYRVYDERVGQSTPFKRDTLFGTQPDEQNEYTLTLVQVANMLVSYGFYGERSSIESIIHTMVTLLDGRADDDRSQMLNSYGQKYRRQALLDGSGGDAPTSRYANSAHTQHIHKAKAEICKLLLSTSDVLMHSVVTKAMHLLNPEQHKDASAGKEWLAEVTKMLGKGGAAQAYDLKSLSKSDSRGLPELPLEVICLDLLMYENDDIFENCFRLLRCHFLKHRVFREQFVALNIQWGDDAKRYRELEDRVALLRHLIESQSAWLRYEDTGQPDQRVEQVEQQFRFLEDAVAPAELGRGDAGSALLARGAQVMLRHMGMADLLVQAYKLPHLGAAMLDPGMRRQYSVWRVKKAATSFFEHYVAGNHANQLECHQRLLRECIRHNGFAMGMAEVIGALFHDNATNCMKLDSDSDDTDTDVLGNLAKIINFVFNGSPQDQNFDGTAESPMKLPFAPVVAYFIAGTFKDVIAPEDRLLPKNQEMVLDSLESAARQHLYNHGLGPDPSAAYKHRKDLMDNFDPATSPDTVGHAVAHYQGKFGAAQLMFHCRIVETLAMTCQGRATKCQRRCAQMLPLSDIKHVMLEHSGEDLRNGFDGVLRVKLAHAKFLAFVYLDNDITDFDHFKDTSDMWCLLLRFALDIDTFLQSGCSEVMQDYICHGVLPCVRYFYEKHYSKGFGSKDVTDEMTFDERTLQQWATRSKDFRGPEKHALSQQLQARVKELYEQRAGFWHQKSVAEEESMRLQQICFAALALHVEAAIDEDEDDGDETKAGNDTQRGEERPRAVSAEANVAGVRKTLHRIGRHTISSKEELRIAAEPTQSSGLASQAHQGWKDIIKTACDALKEDREQENPEIKDGVLRSCCRSVLLRPFRCKGVRAAGTADAEPSDALRETLAEQMKCELREMVECFAEVEEKTSEPCEYLQARTKLKVTPLFPNEIDRATGQPLPSFQAPKLAMALEHGPLYQHKEVAISADGRGEGSSFKERRPSTGKSRGSANAPRRHVASALAESYSTNFGSGLPAKRGGVEKRFHSNPVSFELLCRRMIGFAAKCSESGDPQILAVILDVLRELMRYIPDADVRDKRGKVLVERNARWLDDVTETGLHRKAQSITELNLEEWWKARQHTLARYGACDMIFKLLMSTQTTATDSEDGMQLRMATLQFAADLLEGGNQEVQKVFFDSLVGSKHDRFFAKLRDDIRRSVDGVRLKREEIRATRAWNKQHNLATERDELPGAVAAPGRAHQGTEAHSDEGLRLKDGPHWKEFEKLHVKELVFFLQRLVEGHYRDFQNLLRSQKAHKFRNDINIVEACVELLKVMVTDQLVLKQDVDQIDCQVIEQLLDFLKEACQGPCAQNQLFVLESGVVDVVKLLLDEPADASTLQGSPKPKLETWQEVQGLTVQLLLSLLEGRSSGSRVHERLNKGLDARMFEKRLSRLLGAHLVNRHRIRGAKTERVRGDEVAEVTRSTRKHAQATYTQRSFDVINLSKALSSRRQKFAVNPRTITLPPEWSQKCVGNVQHKALKGTPKDMSSALQRFVLEGQLTAKEAKHLWYRLTSKHFKKELTNWKVDPLQDHRRIQRDFDTGSKVRCIEVNWEGVGLQRVYFPKPTQVNLLKEEEKEVLMASLDFTSDDKVRKFLEQGEEWFYVLKYRDRLQKYFAYRLANKNFDLLQQFSFFLAVLINTALVVGLEQGQASCSDAEIPVCDEPGFASDQDKLRWLVTIVGICQIVVAATLFLFLFMEELFIVVGRELRKHRSGLGQQMNIKMLLHRSWQQTKALAGAAQKSVLACTSCRRLRDKGAPEEDDDDDDLALLIQSELRRFSRDFANPIKVALLCFALGLVVALYTGHVERWIWALAIAFCALTGSGALRQHLAESDQPLAILYCCIFDIFTDNNVLFYVLYGLCAALGTFYKKYFFCFTLLQLLMMSQALKDVARAVYYPRKRLGMTLLFGLIMVYVFAVIAFYAFPSSMHVKDEATGELEYAECKTMVTCLAAFLHNGMLSGGGVGDYASFEIGNTGL